MTKETKASVAIYGCGGAGINIARKISQDLKEQTVPELTVYFCDTSVSNLVASDKDTPKFIFSQIDETIDGSGGLRAENDAVISRYIPQILAELPTKQLNIVIHSASGGSGSNIGPRIVSELLQQDKHVVCFVVGSAESTTRVNNTIRTLKSYDGICRVRSKPVVMLYLQNSVSKSAVDQNMVHATMFTSLFYSGRNHGVDSKDLYHLLNFQKVTSHEAQVASLNFFTDEIPEAIAEAVIAVGSLRSSDANEEDVQLMFSPEYEFSGHLPAEKPKAIKDVKCVNMVIASGLIPQVNKELSDHLMNLKNVSRARVIETSLLDKGDDFGEDGMLI